MDDYAVGYTAATITIVKSSLLKGRYYKVIAYASTFKSVIGTASYVFFTNCPPHTGSCTVNPRSGKCILLLHDGQLRLTVCLSAAKLCILSKLQSGPKRKLLYCGL